MKKSDLSHVFRIGKAFSDGVAYSRAKLAQDASQWITVHPGGKGPKANGKGNEIRAAKDIFEKLEKGSNERANREDSLLASARSKTNLSEGAFNTLMESGRYWKSPDGTKSRRYFDSEDVLKAKGYRVERSGRGFATIYDQDGDKVSNSKAARLKSDADGVYYDYTDGTFKQGRSTYSF